MIILQRLNPIKFASSVETKCSFGRTTPARLAHFANSAKCEDAVGKVPQFMASKLTGTERAAGGGRRTVLTWNAGGLGGPERTGTGVWAKTATLVEESSSFLGSRIRFSCSGPFASNSTLTRDPGRVPSFEIRQQSTTER